MIRIFLNLEILLSEQINEQDVDTSRPAEIVENEVAAKENTHEKEQNKASELPQTGENETEKTALTGLGLLSASILGLLGLGSKRKKEEK